MAKKPEENQEIIEGAETIAEKTYMYVGPPIKNGLIRKGSIIKNYKEFLKEELEKAPNLEKLFIDVNDATEKLTEIERKDSIYQTWIKEVRNVGI